MITMISPSSGATCGVCKRKIQKGQRRISIAYKSQFGMADKHLCSLCIEKAYKELDMKKEKILVCSKVV